MIRKMFFAQAGNGDVHKNVNFFFDNRLGDISYSVHHIIGMIKHIYTLWLSNAAICVRICVFFFVAAVTILTYASGDL